ncbi:MAG: cadmium-translocating P-type ATPase [Verrucomicrobia bacterium]|nr:cadmium-translocating P-type ATPase [Verrucomicrobiota bacterium]
MGTQENKPLSLAIYIACLALAGIAVHLILRFCVPSLSVYAPWPLYIVLLFGGGPLVFDLLKKLSSLQFGSDLLAGLSIVTSVLLDQYLAGSLVVLMLSGGETLENFAVGVASRVLEALAKRAPTIAHRKTDLRLEDIPVEKIALGDTIQLFPHEICPVDGVVIAGNGVMDEAYLTGEPFLISKAPGSTVLSGSINGEASLTIKATKLAADSRYAQIINVMRQTEKKRPRLVRLADTLGAWYTPLAVAIAVVAWLISGESIRFLAVLVIATPCPLLIAIPVAIIGSISLCAKRGILIKNPVVLEQIDECRTMIFDKTGTLTYGQPELTYQIAYNNIDPQYLLKLVASVERYSKHPLASAILNKAKEEKVSLVDAKQISEPKGKGLQGIVDGHTIVITSRKQLALEGCSKEAALLPEGMGLECVILLDAKLAGYFRFRDQPRADSKSFIHHLGSFHGIDKTMIISGDREEEVRYLADVVGIAEVYAGKSPEEKVDIVVKETVKAKTAYLGDGINDAPALIAATVGIALGKNSDITAEAAGAVIMDNTLERVDEFIHISHRMKKIALQSAIGGMALSFVGMCIAALGFLTPVAGAIAQELIDVAAIVNSLRTIWRPAILTDIPGVEKETV